MPALLRHVAAALRHSAITALDIYAADDISRCCCVSLIAALPLLRVATLLMPYMICRADASYAIRHWRDGAIRHATITLRALMSQRGDVCLLTRYGIAMPLRHCQCYHMATRG